ncbi:MAG: CcmD family protein [Acidobacteriia bacterium]|nr:CcmD family protein [Terriglobia bacterium]
MGTVNTMNYLFAAYTAIWIILAVYLFSIQSREKQLRAELQSLRELVERQSAGKR